MDQPVWLDDAAQWDAALKGLPTPHVLQTWTWGAFKARHGWQPARCLWRNGVGQPAAAAQLLTHVQRPRAMGYIPKGPLLDWDDTPLVESVLGDLEVHARQTSLLFLKIDPDVRADTPTGGATAALLRRRGWRPSFEQIQFRNTMSLDLRPDLDTLLAAMKPKWRYNIRLAARRGVEVRVATEADLPLLYAIYRETAQRDNFIIRAESYYLDAWRAFMQAERASPLMAFVDGEPVAMLILFHFGACTWYMYGASRDCCRELMPNHLLQWEAIRLAQAQGCTRYDLWGAPDVLDERDSMWGVYRFKEGFGATFEPHIGAYDYAPQPWLYRLYTWLRPRLVALSQRRYWRNFGF